MENNLYNDFENRFDSGDELNVIMSLLDDKQLLKLKDAVNFLAKQEVYRLPNFPLAFGGLNAIVYCIEYELARRVGKSIKIEAGLAIRCEKDESVWSNRDWREKEVEVKPVIGEESYVEMAPNGVIEIEDVKVEEVKVKDEGEWV